VTSGQKTGISIITSCCMMGEAYCAKEEKMRCIEIVDILEIMRLGEMGLTQREIAARIKCSKTTVGEVKKRCQDAGLTYATASGMGGKEIKARLYLTSVWVRIEKVAPNWKSVHMCAWKNLGLKAR